MATAQEIKKLDGRAGLRVPGIRDTDTKMESQDIPVSSIFLLYRLTVLK